MLGHVGIVPPCVANSSFGLGGTRTGPASPGPCLGTCITWLEGPKACSKKPASFSSGARWIRALPSQAEQKMGGFDGAGSPISLSVELQNKWVPGWA